MQSPICSRLGIEFPLFAFSHCRDVVVAVSRAGGMGVLGAVGMTPDALESELTWIDDQVEGKPYGIDLIVPNSVADSDSAGISRSHFNIPGEYRQFVHNVLVQYDVDPSGVTDDSFGRKTRLNESIRAQGAAQHMDVAFAHPIRLIANALGVPPATMLERGKAAGVPVAALIGAPDHAVRQAEAGVDILIAAGGEAGGHCGDVSTLVLVPEVIDAVAKHGDIPVLAAGGIVTGRQMAACMAMGAAGAWTGSVWLTTSEAETTPVVREKMLAATSRHTVRSRSRTGKYSRQLRSAWTDAWEEQSAPEPLPMPMQSSVTEPALAKIAKLAEGGHEGAQQLATYWVGQGVGMMNSIQSVRSLIHEFMEDFVRAGERLHGYLEE